MNEVELQVVCEAADLPGVDLLGVWVAAALQPENAGRGLVVRIVSSEEMRALNRRFRGVDKPTNVLSFPWEPPPGASSRDQALGDLVLCAPVVEEEARLQTKSLLAHYAHMVIHGTLHLQGYDHQNADQAELMETLETQILGSLGFSDPYHVSCTNP